MKPLLIKKKLNKKTFFRAMAIPVLLIFAYRNYCSLELIRLSEQEISNLYDVGKGNQDLSVEVAASRTLTVTPRPPKCTKDELMKVRHQLPPEFCVKSHTTGEFWYQQCSFTAATKCPRATWLDYHYIELQKRHMSPSSSSSTISNNSSSSSQPPPFLGISIGCNKGFDAIDTLRMGTFDGSINKTDWKTAMDQD